MSIDLNTMPKLGFGLMRLPENDGIIDLEQVCRMADAYLDAILVLNDDGYITVFAVNRSMEEALPLEVELRGFREGYVVEKVFVLSHPDPKATNIEDNPDNVRPHAGSAAYDDGLLRANLSPLSWNVLQFLRRPKGLL